jgi:hypothetical protein
MAAQGLVLLQQQQLLERMQVPFKDRLVCPLI